MGKYDRKISGSSRGTSVRQGPREGETSASRPSPGELQDSPEYRKVAQWLAAVKFRKKAVGGLDPTDVWKKIEELNRLYEDALLAERVRYNLLIRQARAGGHTSPEDLHGED